MNFIVNAISTVYDLLWGDLFTIPLPGGGALGISLLVLLLIPTGIFFTFRTRFLSVRLFPEMLRVTAEKRPKNGASISGVQALIVSTATRVGMGNLIGVVAAISGGGAGAVFWMWITALIGSSTAFIEATLAQLHKEKDLLYGGWRGGPAYYIHSFVKEKRGGKLGRYSAIAVLSAVIVLRKNATVRVLDILVPIMAACYFIITLILIGMNITVLPDVFRRIFEEAFGIRQVVSGGFGAVIMNGVKRGLFSNEAGSGSAPCAAAAGDTSHPAKTGLLQALGVFIDTIVICSCTAFIILVTPEEKVVGWRVWISSRHPCTTTWGSLGWYSLR